MSNARLTRAEKMQIAEALTALGASAQEIAHWLPDIEAELAPLLDDHDATPPEPAAWGHVEIMGHRDHHALLTRETQLGIAGLRVYIACERGHSVVNRWYAGGAIFSREIDPGAEEESRRWARLNCTHPDCVAVRKRLREIGEAFSRAGKYIDDGPINEVLASADPPSAADVLAMCELVLAEASTRPPTNAEWAPHAERWPRLVAALLSNRTDDGMPY